MKKKILTRFVGVQCEIFILVGQMDGQLSYLGQVLLRFTHVDESLAEIEIYESFTNTSEVSKMDISML